MKIFLLLCFFTCIFIPCVQAQSSIEPTRRYEGTVEYQKTQQHANILDFNYPEKDLEKALEEYVENRVVK